MPVSNSTISQFLWFTFLTVPPVLLFLKARFFTNLPIWLLVLVVAGITWLCINGAMHFRFEHLRDLNQAAAWKDDASLREAWDKTGPADFLAFGFGWLIGILYFVPWLLVYFAVGWIQKRRAGITLDGSGQKTAD